MATFSILMYFLVGVESREVIYSLVNLDGPAIMEYSVSETGVGVIECGLLCMSTYGCNLFHYESKNCYILNSPGLSSVNITTFYGSENWRENCSIPDYPLFGGKFCIKIFPVEQNWTTANITCTENGGQLLRMKSDDFFLKKEVLIKADGGNRYWIDGNDLETEGDWRWGHGSDQWQPGNPSNFEDNEHCLTLRKFMQFNDGTCSTRWTFICEKEM
ncbi:hypothetical protein SNE40_013460 [Patella caerulea]|uniref:C-type lectin domain-containing protein n=1 Tax=Patella caerulea TaxID=87958 RepID=A0AAN8PH68_PATCE